MQLSICRRFVRISDILKELIPFTLIGALMFICVRYIDMILKVSMFKLVLELVVGGFLYCILSFLYVLTFRKDIRNQIIKI